MKKTIILLCFLAATAAANAQLSWDARVGANVSQMSEGKTRMKLGLKAGAGVEYGFSDLIGLRSGLWFSSKGYSLDKTFAIGGDKAVGLYYLELPVQAAFHFKVSEKFGLALNGGLYAAVKLNDPDELKAFDTNAFDTGVDVGLDFLLGNHFVVGGGVQYGFMEVVKDSGSKNLNYGITLGYRF